MEYYFLVLMEILTETLEKLRDEKKYLCSPRDIQRYTLLGSLDRLRKSSRLKDLAIQTMEYRVSMTHVHCYICVMSDSLLPTSLFQFRC